ncbi:hypothetical protein M0R45_007913 [Rubus argutus]|uniref:Uncharacterized protein n=1 Tax=Rubus argutus TaxID=59490 RepID=A0AAW1XZN4_RUBAR
MSDQRRHVLWREGLDGGLRSKLVRRCRRFDDFAFGGEAAQDWGLNSPLPVYLRIKADGTMGLAVVVASIPKRCLWVDNGGGKFVEA